ncbi:MAG: Coenzyme F420 hydrogenase/dehydrogenase, beta subunit C-terminal domain [Chloroflexota bacterium]
MPPLQRIKQAASLGVLDGVEVMYPSEVNEDNLQEIGQILSVTGLDLAILGIPISSDRCFAHGTLTSRDASVRKKAIDRVKAGMDVCAELGGARVMFFLEHDGQNIMTSDELNVEQVYTAGLCTQCGTCAAICPHGAIKMEWDGESGYVLSVDSENCQSCGLCYDICPGHSVDFKGLSDRFLGAGTDHLRIGRYTSCQVGHAIEKTVRWSAASGGIVTALLIAALRNGAIDGAVVTRMDPDSPLEPQTFLATTEAEIYEARGSKYCPVAANLRLRDVLAADGRFALVGLPCHIQGLRKLQTRNRKFIDKVPICISIFCGLNMSPNGTKVLLRRNGIKGSDVRHLKYRGDGWPGGLQVEMTNGQTYAKGYRQYFDNHFRCYEMHRCNLCTDSFGELSDISCGDAWLPEYVNSDDQGTSVVIVRTEYGEQFLSTNGKGVLNLKPLSVEKAIQSQRLALIWKKEWMNAKIGISKFAGREVPVYENDLPPAGFKEISGWTRTNLNRSLHRLWHRMKTP